MVSLARRPKRGPAGGPDGPASARGQVGRLQPLRGFFAANEVIVNAAYGQVFVLLGFALALQYRRHSSLRLARSLPWLAAFGLTHGMQEWGLVFIPIQATYLPRPAVEFFLALQLMLLAVSFACLIQFASSLLPQGFPPPSGKAEPPALQPLAAWLLMVWFVGPFWMGLRLFADLEAWRSSSEVFARYLLGLPGGWLSAAALWRHARNRTETAWEVAAAPSLRWAAGALAAYGLAGGLVGPQAGFFPASVINQANLARWVGVPVQVWRSALGVVLLVAVIRSIEALHRELDRLLDEREKERLIAAERERIARDLHDRTLQRVYSAGLLLQALRQRLPPATREQGLLQQAVGVLDEAIRDIRGYISELRPAGGRESHRDGIEALGAEPGPFKPLATRLQELVGALGLGALAEVHLEVDVPETPGDARRLQHVCLVAAEALSNVARHSQARRVRVKGSLQKGSLLLTVEDDGVGFVPGRRSGRGIDHMTERARLLGGTLRVESRPGEGTRVRLEVPWEAPA